MAIFGSISTPDEFASSPWWQYGEYTGGDCPNCGRQRLIACEQIVDEQISVERVICEKCCWEPARNDYCAEALAGR